MTNKRTGYNGYSKDSEFLKMDWNEFFEYCVGQIARSIVSNKFESVTRTIISQAIAWGMFNDEGH